MSGNSLEALIFDVDGTLAETERDGHRVAFNEAFRGAGLDWHWDVDTYGELLAVTGGKERIRHYIESRKPRMPPVADVNGMISDLHASKTRHYLDLLRAGGIGLRPGVVRLLAEARKAGLRLAIATTTTPQNVAVLLECTLDGGAQGWFEEIGAGDVVEQKKPAPDIYEYVCRKIGLDPGVCLAIEDSHNGVISARKAGIPVLVTSGRYTRGEDFEGAAAVLDGLGEPGAGAKVLRGPSLDGDCVDPGYLKRVWSRGR